MITSCWLSTSYFWCPLLLRFNHLLVNYLLSYAQITWRNDNVCVHHVLTVIVELPQDSDILLMSTLGGCFKSLDLMTGHNQIDNYITFMLVLKKDLEAWATWDIHEEVDLSSWDTKACCL